MDIKFSLIIKLIITYITLLAICFLFYALIISPVTGADKVNAIIGLLGWSGTIFAPIAAYYLLDSWKHQKSYELKKEYIGNILQELRPIFLNTLNMLTQTSNIKRVNEILVINTDYLNYKSNLIGDLIVNLYSNVKVYSKISRDDKILKLYKSLELHSYFLDDYYKKLIKEYSVYFQHFVENRKFDENKDYVIYRNYIGSEKDVVTTSIYTIDRYLMRKHFHEKNIESPDITLEYTYEELFKNTIGLIKEIQEMCLNEFEP